MRNIFLCILLLLFAYGCATQPVTGKSQLPIGFPEESPVAPAPEESYKKSLKDSDVAWRPDIKAAEVESKHMKMPMFIYFYGSKWCGTMCDYMDQNIFTDEQVVKILNEKFVTVRVDITGGSTQTQQSYVTKYKLQAIPAYYFQSWDGEKSTYAHGQINTPEEFIRGLNLVLNEL